MFLLTCVILFTGWGQLRNMHHRSHDQHPGGGLPSMYHRSHDQGGSASRGGEVCIQGTGGVYIQEGGGVGQTSPLHLKWESGRYASYWNASLFITARKRSLRRLCFYTCLSTRGGGELSQYALQVVYQHTLQQVSGGGVISQHALQVSRPTRSGEVEGDLGGGSPGPHPRWKLRVSQVHTQGGLQAHTCGVSIPACTEAEPPPPPTATAAGGTHPTGMHSC